MAAGKTKLKNRPLNIQPANRNASPALAHLEAGLAHHKAGRVVEARVSYEKALALEPNNPDGLQLLGVLIHREGDAAQGIALLKRAVEIDPNHAVAHNNLGGALRTIGEFSAAEREFSTALKLAPDYTDALTNWATVLGDLERYDDAAMGLRKVLDRNPNHPEARRNLGRVCLKLRMFAEAEQHLRAYLQQVPNRDEEVANLAFAVQQQGRAEEAEALFRQAMELAKDNPMLLHNLQGLLATKARSDEEREKFRQALKKNPGMWSVEIGVAVNLIDRGKLEQGQQIIDDILAVHANEPAIWSDVGGTLLTLGRFKEAEPVLKRAAEMDPKSASVQNNLANVYLFTNRLDLAAEASRRSLALNPTAAKTYITLSRTLYQQGKHDQAHFLARASLDAPTAGIEQMPSLLGIFHALCDFDGMDRLGDIFEGSARLQLDVLVALYLNLLPEVRTKADMEKFKALVARWANNMEIMAEQSPLPPLTDHRPSPDGRIRLGILSSDLRSHSVTRFLLPFVQGHDRSKISLHCYTPFRAELDPYQAEYRKAADKFVYVDNLTAREIAERIRADHIDVLLELNGFTYESRVAAMAFKPAPVQMSWIGYPATCGLKAIDYVVLDQFVSPSDESSFIEQPLIMPEAYVCFGKFPEETINPTLPMDRNGYVTFGTLNNPYKYNRETIAMWAQVLRQVPNSRFLIVRPEASSMVLCTNLVAEFAKHGIGADRLFLFDNRTVNRNHLSYYNDIDISLDTFPLTGGTTTCEAVWMGVPVVSLVGDYNHQRISYSVLMHCGLEELCAFTPEDYVARAVALAGERDKLALWRTGLREVMRESPLCDEPRFLYQFQEMLDQIAQLHGLR